MFHQTNINLKFEVLNLKCMLKKVYFFYIFLLSICPLFVFAQIPLSISDLDFSSDDSFDNWTHNGESFFVVPVQLNEYVALEKIEFNINYNPNIISPVSNAILVQINQQEFLNNQNVASYSLLNNGTLGLETFNGGSQLEMLTFSYLSNSSFSENEYQDQNGTLVYLAFTKQDPCYEGPILFQFTNGESEGVFLNPNQTSAVSINDSFTTENNLIFSIDGSVLFNILTIDLVDQESFFSVNITDGLSPYSYNWTNKLGETLSSDSLFYPNESGDYLVYVSDSSQCISSLYFSFEQPSTVEEFFNLNIWPNPFTNHININSNLSVDYSLFDTNGRIVSQSNNIESIKISTQTLKAGVYFLKISNSTKTRVFKLISN